MRVFPRFFLLCVAFLGASLLCSGCSSPSQVRLVYHSAGDIAVPSASKARVVVLPFLDKRNVSGIGEDTDGNRIFPASSISDWVTRAFSETLRREGLQVSSADSALQAAGSKPDYILDGDIEHAWMKMKSMNKYEAKIRLKVRIQKGSKAPLVLNFSSGHEKSGIPGERLAEETLSGTLEEIMENAKNAVLPQLK